MSGRRYLEGPACVGQLVELPGGTIGQAVAMAGPDTLWVHVQGENVERVAANVNDCRPVLVLED